MCSQEVSMCGRFAQSQTREDYLAFLAEDIERDI
ncbi:SOS response-associated peptidase, partial [Klebsiella pneumoniae]